MKDLFNKLAERKGDILIYNVVDLPAPRFLKKYNVGGKVVSIKQLGVISAYYDMY